MGVEMCSGTLRNLRTYSNACSIVHAVEMVPELTAKYPLVTTSSESTTSTGSLSVSDETTIVAHTTPLQEWSWPEYGVDLVIGMWSLCYLSWPDLNDLLARIYCSLRAGGRVIINEPILEDVDVLDERYQEEPKQQMIVRSLGLYLELFKHHKLDATISEMDGAKHELMGSDRLVMFVLKKAGDEALLVRL